MAIPALILRGLMGGARAAARVAIPSIRVVSIISHGARILTPASDVFAPGELAKFPKNLRHATLKLDVQIDSEDLFALENTLVALKREGFKGLRFAISDTLKQTRTYVVKQVFESVHLDRARIKKDVSIRVRHRARRRGGGKLIISSGRPPGLFAFDKGRLKPSHHVPGPRPPGKGVRVRVRKQKWSRKALVKRSFVAIPKGQTKPQVFRRIFPRQITTGPPHPGRRRWRLTRMVGPTVHGVVTGKPGFQKDLEQFMAARYIKILNDRIGRALKRTRRMAVRRIRRGVRR